MSTVDTKQLLIDNITLTSAVNPFELTEVGTIRTKFIDRDRLVGDCPLLAVAKNLNYERFRNYRNLDFSLDHSRVSSNVRDQIRSLFGYDYFWVLDAADKPSHPDRQLLLNACGLGTIDM